MDTCEPTSPDQQLQLVQCRALAGLWRAQQLVDVQLKATNGELLGAHRIVLAASSGFFKAVFCGAGQSMREGAACSPNNMVVELPYSQPQIAALLAIIYEHNIRVCASNVAWMLDMASYLEVQPLLDACCSFLQSALSPETCVDVLLLANHYQCSDLQLEGVQYLAQHLSSLLLLPEARQALTRLPQGLLMQLLASGELEVEQEAELLCLVADWVAAAPQERLPHLHQLLSLLQLSLLPEEAPLSVQQLKACTTPDAAQLAWQLHKAALQCQQQQQQPQLRVLHPTDRSVQQHLADSIVQQQNKKAKGEHGGLIEAAGRQQLEGLGQSHTAADGDSQLHQQQQKLQADTSVALSPALVSAAAAADAAAYDTSPCTSSWIDMNNQATSSSIASSSSSSSAAVRYCTGVHDLPAWFECGVDSGSSRHCIGAILLDAWPGRQRGYQPTRLLVAGGHDLSWRGLKAVELYEPRSDTWSPGPALPAALPFAGAGMLGRGELYVVGGGMYSSLLVRLDAAAGCWHTCDGPRTPRLHAAVTGTSGLLYVTGGRSQVNQVLSTVEVYDPSTYCWSSLPDMQKARYAHAVASMAGRVYALGGQAMKAIHRTVEVFDANRGSWELLPHHMSSERKYCAAAAFGGRLLVLGGMNESRSRLSSMEGYDPREGRWQQLSSMKHARSSCGVAAVGGRLYAVGGNAGDQQLHAAVESYDPAAGKWMNCTALSCGRSGLLAAAV